MDLRSSSARQSNHDLNNENLRENYETVVSTGLSHGQTRGNDKYSQNRVLSRHDPIANAQTFQQSDVGHGSFDQYERRSLNAPYPQLRVTPKFGRMLTMDRVYTAEIVFERKSIIVLYMVLVLIVRGRWPKKL
uniref:Uncharacterized protein n=1 Tax=Romanomermis culicivorax TaxID=13658 RepID=A0A915I4R5_ROMCU